MKVKRLEVEDEAGVPKAPVHLDDMKGKAIQVEDEGVETNALVYLHNMKNKGLEVEDKADEPNAPVNLDYMKSKVLELKDESDEPNTPVHLDYMKSKGLEVEDEADEANTPVHLDYKKSNGLEVEDEADEPNSQVRLDNLKGKDFEAEAVNTKPNFVTGTFFTFDTGGCYLQILVLTFALLFSGTNAAFVEVPNNTVVLEWNFPKVVVMACKSNCQCNLRWFVNKNHDEKEDLYNGYFLSSDANSYCSVTADEPGKYNLNLMNKPDAAQTYICLEPGTLAEASADLILIRDLICNNISTDDVVHLTCSIEFRGNWAPTMEWKEHSSHGEKVILVGVHTTTVPNQLVTSALVMPVQKGRSNFTCTAKFDINGKPHSTTATNVPRDERSWTFSAFPKSQDEMTTESVVPTGAIAAISVGTIFTAASMIGIVYGWRKREKAKIAMKAELASLRA